MPRPEKQAPPPPWQALPAYAVGGLLQVGYAAGTDLLLVLSSQGRGVFDCLTGEKVARDYDEADDGFDAIRLTVEGIGPLAGLTVRTGGEYGGGLPLTTRDGWALSEEVRDWPTHQVFLHRLASGDRTFVADDGACEMRAYGFSETGRSFVIATSCDLAIFTRPE